MKPSSIVKIIGLLAICIAPTAFASFGYDADEIKGKVIDEAIRQDIAPSLALAIAKVESDFNPQALSHAGAKGVMQIMPRTAELGFGVNSQRLFDPAVNIEIGIKFIKKLLEKYDNRLDIALSHYNGGSAVRNGYGKLSVIPATRQYVDKVMATQQEFLHHDNLSRLASSSTSTVNSTINNDADEPSQDPQINTLRALRVHNITRNYKNTEQSHIKKPNQTRLVQNIPQAIPQNITAQNFSFEASHSAQGAINARIAKVRQWEAIYNN